MFKKLLHKAKNFWSKFGKIVGKAIVIAGALAAKYFLLSYASNPDKSAADIIRRANPFASKQPSATSADGHKFTQRLAKILSDRRYTDVLVTPIARLMGAQVYISPAPEFDWHIVGQKVNPGPQHHPYAPRQVSTTTARSFYQPSFAEEFPSGWPNSVRQKDEFFF